MGKSEADNITVLIKKNGKILFEGSFENCNICQKRDVEPFYRATKNNWGRPSELKVAPYSERVLITLS